MGNDFITGPLKHFQTKLMIETRYHVPSNMSFPSRQSFILSACYLFNCFWTRERLLYLSRSEIRARRGNGLTRKELTRASLIRWWSAGVFFFLQIETNWASGSYVISGNQLYKTNEWWEKWGKLAITWEQWCCFTPEFLTPMQGF